MKEGFTSNAASIRCVNGVWGKIEMKELGAPLYSSAFQGQYAVQDLRVSGSENGMAILCLKQAASLLSAWASSHLFRAHRVLSSRLGPAAGR